MWAKWDLWPYFFKFNFSISFQKKFEIFMTSFDFFPRNKFFSFFLKMLIFSVKKLFKIFFNTCEKKKIDFGEKKILANFSRK